MNKIFIYRAAKNPAKSWGSTPLHLAAERGHLEVCELIIEKAPEKANVVIRRIDVSK